MIVKYFKEDYHFPLRYFLYIGITAMVRLIIVEHDDAVNTMFYSFVILILIIGYFIMNLTPRERPESKWRSEEHTSELQSRFDLVCRLLLEKKTQRSCIFSD